jgi:hypothetical protein
MNLKNFFELNMLILSFFLYSHFFFNPICDLRLLMFLYKMVMGNLVMVSQKCTQISTQIRTHNHPTKTSANNYNEQELQLHLGVLQQHAALIGGPNATSCPICHKLFLGGEALMEHMKHTHKDPNASGVASKYKKQIFFSFFVFNSFC